MYCFHIEAWKFQYTFVLIVWTNIIQKFPIVFDGKKESHNTNKVKMAFWYNDRIIKSISSQEHWFLYYFFSTNKKNI